MSDPRGPIPRELLDLEAVQELKEDLEDVEHQFVERFAEFFDGLLRAEGQAALRRSTSAGGVPDLSTMHKAFAQHK